MTSTDITPPSYRTAAPLEAATQKFVDGLAAAGGPPIYTLSPQEAREVLRGAQAGTTGPDADVEDRTVPGGEMGEVSVRILRPKGSTGTLPVVLYLHGGGWVLGDQDTHDRLLRDLVAGSGAAVVFVNYTPSPEARFPTAIEQGYAVARWITQQGREARLDPNRLAVAGDSVGGNMAIALTLLARERGDVTFRHQLLFYPVTDAAFDDGSYTQFQDGPWLTRPAMRWFWDAYTRNEADRASPLASPLRAPVSALQELPEALVITDENDVLRDEGEAYARRLIAAGVPTTTVRYNGILHDFMMLNALKDSPATRAAIAQASAVIRQALQ